jgi:hypothetical protein
MHDDHIDVDPSHSYQRWTTPAIGQTPPKAPAVPLQPILTAQALGVITTNLLVVACDWRTTAPH